VVALRLYILEQKQKGLKAVNNISDGGDCAIGEAAK
jgi:hypothetical protein